MILFYFTQDWGASEGYTSHPDNVNIRVELKFGMPLPEAISEYFVSDLIIPFALIIREQSWQNSENGQDSDVLHIKKSEIVFGSFPSD